MQLDVNVLGAAEHAAQAWEAAVAARSERTSQQHLAPWLRLSPSCATLAGGASDSKYITTQDTGLL
mgnify:CR=1 FL=1